MALHELQIAEVDIENAARPPLLVDQLDDHPAFVNSCVIANDTLRSRGVLSYGAHFLEAGREGLKSRPRPAEERELADAQSKVGELQLENDILRALLEKKGHRPLARLPLRAGDERLRQALHPDAQGAGALNRALRQLRAAPTRRPRLRRLYNRERLLERHGYRTPIEARQHLLATP